MIAATAKAHAAALRAASGAVFIVHLFKTAFALVVLGGLGLKLANVARHGDLVDVASVAMREAPRHAAAAQWAVFAYLLVGPLLTQFVLAALLRRTQPQLAALRRYGRALGISMLRFLALGLTIAGAFASCFALAKLAPPELETAARIAPLGLGALLLAWLSTAHDVAAARLAITEAPRAIDTLAHGVRGASAKLIATHLLFLLATTLCYAAGEASSRNLSSSPGLALSQALALAAAFVSAGWLSVVLDQTHQLSRPELERPAIRAGGSTAPTR